MAKSHYDPARNRIVGRVLREVRTDAGLSLDAASERSGRAFCTSLIGSYERGERTVDTARLIELALLYQVLPTVLMSVIESRCSDPISGATVPT